MEKVRHIQTPWLLGQEGVCQYLGDIDIRTLRKHFISKGLHPRYVIERLQYYHKDDVDKFLKEHNQWQEVPTTNNPETPILL